MTHRSPFPAELTAIAQRLGLAPDTIYYCLEVNLAGVEIILRMRRQMLAMQAQLEAMTTEMRAAQNHFEQQIRELERRLAHDLW